MFGRLRMRKAGLVLATLGAAMTLVLGTAGTAPAAIIANGGSAALYDVTKILTDEYTAEVDPDENTSITAPNGTTPFSLGKPGCDAYYSTHPWPSGPAVLRQERLGTAPDCFAFARSEANPGPGDDLTYVRVAGDAVTWATRKPGAPNSLTKAALRGIYDCTITDWNQLPGSTASGAIQKHLPRIGSGVRQNFITFLLDGFDPTSVFNGPCASTIIQTTQQDLGDDPAITSANAVIPFGQAAYGAQTSPPTGVVNHTNGFRLGRVDGKAPNATGFAGNHSVYYVFDPLDTENDAKAIQFINWAKAPQQRYLWQVFGFTV